MVCLLARVCLILQKNTTGHVNVDIDIFVISEPKWLKFGLQAHFFKMFWHAKFQLSISSMYFQSYEAFSESH